MSVALFSAAEPHAPCFAGVLRDYQKTLGAAHAFQVVRDAPFARVDCFAERSPVSVPALTFLSQLL
ncbi:MAG: hypothetical protein IKL85_06395 [Lentisphaeria bacterium]|nr:hypothetical protein [Lentisphaeria bacterium]